VALSDKQYYYTIIGTRMDQFGLSMNFLGIKQVLVIIFTLKINFYFIFLDFLFRSTARKILEKRRGLCARTPRLRALYAVLRVNIPEIQGLFNKSTWPMGYASPRSTRSQNDGHDLIIYTPKRYAISTIGSLFNCLDSISRNPTRTVRSR
jgi:hypothetical protein